MYGIIALLLVALFGGGYYFYNQNKQKEGFQKQLVADSIARDSIGKVEKNSCILLNRHMKKPCFNLINNQV